MRRIGFDAHFRGVYRSVKAGPAGAGIELRGGVKQLRAAARARIHSLFVVIPVLAGEGRFRTFLPRDGILFRGELFPPFFVGFANFFHNTFSLQGGRLECSRLAARLSSLN